MQSIRQSFHLSLRANWERSSKCWVCLASLLLVQKFALQQGAILFVPTLLPRRCQK
jgi:hypothetical protein